MTGQRVMVVEDEALSALYVRLMLEELGFQITSIEDTGLHAIEMATKDKPDIVLMDVKLKGEMTGIEAANKISDELGVPVIIMTAYGSTEIDLTEYAYACIDKPFQEKELLDAIDAVAKQGQDNKI